MKTQVAIIGGGPSGLLLSQLLNRAGVDTVILERASRDHVLSRIRAGVLEWGSVELMREAGVAERLEARGHPHGGCVITDHDLQVRIDFQALTGRSVMVYGQTEVTADLYAAQDRFETPILHGVEMIEIGDPTSDPIELAFRHDGQNKQITCQFLAGCDGFHGVSRRRIPKTSRREFERVYPFGWLGVLSRTRPAHNELIYAHAQNGFALASMRNDRLSRYYVQVPLSEKADDWSDARFWDAVRTRLPANIAEAMEIGPSIEKSIAPLRSFVSDPLRWGNMFLVGDAAHIVPPTGAKGLNLAFSDVFYLHEALISAVVRKDHRGIDAYSERALARIWKAMRFSWQMTIMTHRFDDEDNFAAQMRSATLAHLAGSESAQRDLAENYVGLPY